MKWNPTSLKLWHLEHHSLTANNNNLNWDCQIYYLSLICGTRATLLLLWWVTYKLGSEPSVIPITPLTPYSQPTEWIPPTYITLEKLSLKCGEELGLFFKKLGMKPPFFRENGSAQDHCFCLSWLVVLWNWENVLQLQQGHVLNSYYN